MYSFVKISWQKRNNKKGSNNQIKRKYRKKIEINKIFSALKKVVVLILNLN
jgi:hypothetical protein